MTTDTGLEGNLPMPRAGRPTPIPIFHIFSDEFFTLIAAWQPAGRSARPQFGTAGSHEWRRQHAANAWLLLLPSTVVAGVFIGCADKIGQFPLARAKSGVEMPAIGRGENCCAKRSLPDRSLVFCYSLIFGFVVPALAGKTA